MASGTVRLKGYREFVRACNQAPKDTKKFVRDEFRKVGDIVKVDASQLFASVDARTAAGFKTRVRVSGVAVEQSLPRTTGLRPDYGALQMRRALLPSLANNEDNLQRAMEHAIDEVADRFERGT